MWKRGREELSYLVSQEQWLRGWKTRINRGDAVAIGEHAILGCDWDETDVCNTSFQASESFEAPGVGKQVTKALRREIPRLMKETGARLCFVYSLCVDPQAAKWFQLLGFEEDKGYRGITRGPYVSRRFLRRAG